MAKPALDLDLGPLPTGSSPGASWPFSCFASGNNWSHMDDSGHSALPFYRRNIPIFETPAMRARRKQRRFIIGIVLICFTVICSTQVMIGLDRSYELVAKKEAVKSEHSMVWDQGYQDGRAAGLADAERRRASIGRRADPNAVPRSTPPRRGFGPDRREFQAGWNVGYTSATDQR